MGGTSTQQSATQQSSKTSPWEPTQGILKDILGGVSGQFGNYAPNAAETGAINTLSRNAQNAPNYAPQAMQLSKDLMGGGTGPSAGILNDAYANYQKQLNPIANQSNDPMQAPGMQALLETIRGDVSNNINGLFAGAGRDLSGAHAQALGRGISQGEAAPLLAQYNQNVQNQTGAAGNLFTAGGATASGLQDLSQQGLQNRALGLDVGINGVPAAQNSGAQGILSAESLRRNLPIQNLAGILGLTLPIAGLGSQSSGTSNTNGSYTMSPIQQIMGLSGAYKNFGFGGSK